MLALFYPFFLKGFNFSLVTDGPSLSPVLMLALAFSVPSYGFFASLKLGRIAQPDLSQVIAKRLALLAVATPPIYTATGVLLYMAGDPIADTTLWIIGWALIAFYSIISMRRAKGTPVGAVTASPRLRIMHGISALCIIVLFLTMHLLNHLAGLLSEETHRHVMDMFRMIYRARLIEPMIVFLFFFQVVSGLGLLRIHTLRPADFFRTLQIASGAYLVFFILAHMNSVFIFARRFAHILTDWDFATGAPTGLIQDAWNIRLVPHYYLGVFLVLSHLVLGCRIVALGHGVRRLLADRYAKVGIALSAGAALAIMLGMTGIHFIH
ncbi:hypothetical protein [Collimonas sp. OK307]|uniref:hypothetical protein n=1 Tax=Collimonas sp. OK307 TaxID=1801620 RepID=UPI0011137BC3|nr:hypothetical protein [Collimonas sp. OK307]